MRAKIDNLSLVLTAETMRDVRTLEKLAKLGGQPGVKCDLCDKLCSSERGKVIHVARAHNDGN